MTIGGDIKLCDLLVVYQGGHVYLHTMNALELAGSLFHMVLLPSLKPEALPSVASNLCAYLAPRPGHATIDYSDGMNFEDHDMRECFFLNAMRRAKRSMKKVPKAVQQKLPR